MKVEYEKEHIELVLRALNAVCVKGIDNAENLVVAGKILKQKAQMKEERKKDPEKQEGREE